MLCAITTLSFNNDQINLCEKDYLYSAIKNKQNNKSHGDDGLTKDFYEGFWNEIKKLLIASVIETKGKGQLTILQSQAIIKLIEKKRKN